VRFEVELDLAATGTLRCNCSLCTKQRLWFTFARGNQLRLTQGQAELAAYRWRPPAQAESRLTYRFCRHCGILLFAEDNSAGAAGAPAFFAVSVAALDDASIDELAAAPLRYEDGLNDRHDRAPADTRLL